MKTRRLVQCLIGGFIGSSLLFSCSSEEFGGEKENVKQEFQVNSSEQSVSVDINYDVPDGYKVVFDV